MTSHAPAGTAVSIIGGSAAGLFAACLLSRRQVPVRVFERADRLDPLSRTLIVTSRMRDLLGSVGETAVVNEIRRFELFTDGRVASISLARPDLIIERATLIRALAQHARAHGAEIVFGKRFVGFEPQATGLTLCFAGAGLADRFHATTVIGADGALSRVAQAAGWPRQATVPLVQAVVRLPADLPPDSVRVW
ncbi:MAG: FAD-dependent oxidoreductase, partial [Thermoanaerobaculia bacterium]